MRLLYTNSGVALLALASNAVHKLWKWQRTERNPSGKVGIYNFILGSLFTFFYIISVDPISDYIFFQSTASIVPQLWQPSNGALMTNDLSDAKSSEESAACIALSKNDSYVMSASGGKVSLFNMMTFKVSGYPYY